MNDILKNSLFLIFTLIIVHFFFSGFIRPEANLIIEIAKNTQTSVPRNFFVIVKDLEQEICFILLILGVFKKNSRIKGMCLLQRPYKVF